MYCKNCGAENQAESGQCKNCGGFLSEESARIRPHGTVSYLVWSIVATIFCCAPAGVAAIVFSGMARSRLSRGDYTGARNSLKSARALIIVSMVLGAFMWLLYLYYFNFAATGTNPFSAPPS